MIRTGTTPEGTRYTVRPWSAEVEQKYRCIHRGGIVPCALTHDECTTGYRHHFNLGGDGKRRKGAKTAYSPATPPMPSASNGLPADVGAAFAAAHALAVLRVSGAAPWPEPEIEAAPKLKLPATDASFTKSYRAFVSVAGPLPVAAGDRHGGRWWPSYALEALDHLDRGSCPSGASRCQECRQAKKEGFIPCDA